jgi:hypothetical protein
MGTIATLVWLLSSLAFAGPGASGGGNGIGSSADDVKKALVDAKLNLGVFLHSASIYSDSALSPSLVKNAQAQKVLQAWLEKDGSVEKIISDIDNSEYKPQANECPSQSDDDHDGSTLHKKNAPVCFSTDRLSRFPKWALDAELVALAAHEHAHHFGFGESDARAIQGYIFNVYGFLQVQEKLKSFYNSDLQNYRARSANGSWQAAGFSEEICRDFAAIEGFATAYNLDRFKLDSTKEPGCKPDQFDPDSLESRLRLLESATVTDFNK